MRVLGEKVARSKQRQMPVDEQVLGRVLDQYSNRLFEMLDERLAGLNLGKSVAGSVASEDGGEDRGLGISGAIQRNGNLESTIEEVHEDAEGEVHTAARASKDVHRAGSV